MKFETYEYTLGDWWACALINGDETGLSDAESEQLDAWIASQTWAGKAYHFDGFSEEDSQGFCRDDVTGLAGDCYTFRVLVQM